MFPSIPILFIVCPLVFTAGLVDSIAGGGGLISLPAYLIAGIPPHQAIATNKLSSSIGTTISAARYIKNGYVNFLLAIPSILLALIGSVIGAYLTLLIPEVYFKYILSAVLPVVAYFVLRKDKKENLLYERTVSFKRQVIIVILSSFIIGTYDGFYGPGTGTFLLFIYTKIAGMELRTASGNVKLVNLSSNIGSLITFLMKGQTLISLGLISGLFCLLGHYIGSGLVIKNGYKIVKPIVILVLFLLFIKILTS